MAERILTLYSGEGCHLCEHARDLIWQAIDQSGWSLQEISILGDPALQDRYGWTIPVIVLPDGTEKGWPFTAGQVRRMITATSG